MLYPSFSNLYARWYEEELRESWEEKNSLLNSNRDTAAVASTIQEFQGMILKIPAIGLYTAVQKGTSPDVLKKTPGWFEESALPGQGNTAIAAHLNMYGSWFRFLDNLSPGEPIYLQHGGYEYIYIVEEKFSVDSTDLSITQDCGYPALTLTTCIAENKSRRLVVRARRSDIVPMSF
ncbi:MAG TPA: sortase [Peptococcaceae bacterium]|nr:sortase [Peptococcaceae bacterium]